MSVSLGVSERTHRLVEPLVALDLPPYIPPYTGRRAVSRFTNIELGNSETPLLYHLKTDIGQQQNLATDSLSQLESMQKQYKTILGVE